LNYACRIQVAPLVTGVSGAQHQSFSSEEEARLVFEEASRAGNTSCLGGNTSGLVRSSSEVIVGSILGPVPVPARTRSEPGSGVALTFPMISESGQSSPTGVRTPNVRSMSSSPPTGVTQIVGSARTESSRSTHSSPTRGSVRRTSSRGPPGASVHTPSVGSYPSVISSPTSRRESGSAATLSPLSSPIFSAANVEERRESNTNHTISPRIVPLPQSPGFHSHSYSECSRVEVNLFLPNVNVNTDRIFRCVQDVGIV
jgi:hypothetical protein